MNAATLINQTSGDQEYYTPQPIVSAARAAMGSIDLDPASSPAADKFIRAGMIYTKDSDGLSTAWFGRVWLNHPFGRVENPLWVAKILEEVAAKRVEQLCCITYACTSEAWFQPLLKQPQCFLCPRTNFYLPDGTLKRGVTKGSVVTYFGPRENRFRQAFAKLGTVKL